ncbi:MAG: hypothetical protein IJV82_03590 [Oscillospiraceae bacterium]|nr:hypothetical protein [Oscillospiraceae bacterium]
MASVREYCEMMSTEQLQALLQKEYEGKGNLPLLAILDICDLLSERDPNKPNVEQLLHKLCEHYLQ